MTIKQCRDYFRRFDRAGAVVHSGALPGQEEIDFRNNPAPERRVYLIFRKSDGRILFVIYWKLGEGEEQTFSTEELQGLLQLNAGNGELTTRLKQNQENGFGSEFIVTTPKQYQLHQGEFN
jgi:hypothetical protein